MPEQVLTDVGIWIDGLAYAFVSNSVSFEGSADAPEKTTFKGEWRRRAAGGLKTASFSLDGFVDTAGPDAERFEALGDGQSVMVVPAGETPGELAYIIPVTVSAHTPLAGAVGDLATFSYAGEGDGQPARAQVVEIRENIHANHTSSQVQLGAILAGQRMRVFLHATEVTAGDFDVNIRSGSQGGVTTSRAFRNTWNSTGMFELTIDGPITHDWWDVHYTGVSGAFDMAVAAAIG